MQPVPVQQYKQITPCEGISVRTSDRDETGSACIQEELMEDGHFTYSCEFAVKHAAIIERFGRFPHRNAILGRASTPEEAEFLRGPDSSF
jgi:uncharacterized protein (DUF924 family)